MSLVHALRALASWGFVSCLGLAQAAPELPAAAQPGDLIFRQGTEAISDAVLAVDGGPFSHVGLLLGGPGHWQVLHATPSEMAGRPDGVAQDTLAFYLDPARARRYAVYHVPADDTQRQAAVAFALKMLGRAFRLADEAGTYCTLLVWEAWQQAGVDLHIEFTPLSLPLLPGTYLLPSSLMKSPRAIALTPVLDVAGGVSPPARSAGGMFP